METTVPQSNPVKTHRILSVVVPIPLAHATRCSAAHAGMTLSRYVRRLIEAAVAAGVPTVNSIEPTDITQTDDTIVAAAE